MAALEAERPRILGALLDAVSKGLAMLPHTRLDKLPRMADFALWATACETALWPPGTFWAAYSGNRDEAVEDVIEADAVATAVRSMMAQRPEWTGTASDLLGALAATPAVSDSKSKAWPDSPRALAGRLRRAATVLRKAGVEISFDREGHARTRVIRITKAPESLQAAPSAPSASSSPLPNPAVPKGFGALRQRTIAKDADAAGNAQVDRPLKSAAQVRKLVQMISSNKDKLKVYCDLNQLDKQLEEAEQRKDSHALEALASNAKLVPSTHRLWMG